MEESVRSPSPESTARVSPVLPGPPPLVEAEAKRPPTAPSSTHLTGQTLAAEETTAADESGTFAQGQPLPAAVEARDEGRDSSSGGRAASTLERRHYTPVKRPRSFHTPPEIIPMMESSTTRQLSEQHPTAHLSRPTDMEELPVETTDAAGSPTEETRLLASSSNVLPPLTDTTTGDVPGVSPVVASPAASSTLAVEVEDLDEVTAQTITRQSATTAARRRRRPVQFGGYAPCRSRKRQRLPATMTGGGSDSLNTPSSPGGSKPLLNMAGVNIAGMLAESSDPPPAFNRRSRRTRRRVSLLEDNPIFMEHKDLRMNAFEEFFVASPLATDADVLNSLNEWTAPAEIVYAELLWKYAPDAALALVTGTVPTHWVSDPRDADAA